MAQTQERSVRSGSVRHRLKSRTVFYEYDVDGGTLWGTKKGIAHYKAVGDEMQMKFNQENCEESTDI